MNINYIKQNEILKDSIINLLNSNSIEFFIQNRVKTKESHNKKLAKNIHSHYNNEITDISGIRIIVSRLSEMRRCIELIINSYKIDYQNSNFNSLSFKDTNEFGYASSHIIIQQDNLKTEVQIRTLPQHIWAITSHELLYKSDKKDAFFERKLFRLSGLLEQIDVLIEDLYDSKSLINDKRYNTLDHYSLEYFLSRKERIFSLVNICFERKVSSIGKINYPLSMKILDGSKALHSNDKNSMDLILIACVCLKIDTTQQLKDYIISKRSNAKKIRSKFASLNFPSEALSPALRLFLFLMIEIQFPVLKEKIKHIVHSKFLENIEAYHEH